MDDPFTAVFDVISTIIGLAIPLGIFLSGALAVLLSYIFGRRLLRWLLRLVTRNYTLCIAVHSDIAGDIAARLDPVFRANGVLAHGLDMIPAWGTGPALIKVRVKINSRFKYKAALARLRQGMMGVAGVQDFYEEV